MNKREQLVTELETRINGLYPGVTLSDPTFINHTTDGRFDIVIRASYFDKSFRIVAQVYNHGERVNLVGVN